MKRIMIVCVAVAAFAAPAFAEATYQLKDQAPAGPTNPVGAGSSNATGNGGVIGGNAGGFDETTYPGSRAFGLYGVQDALATVGKGMINNNK
jgi:hypothetical protein